MDFRHLRVALVATVFVIVAALPVRAEGAKIGLINMQKVLMESKVGKEAKVSFESELNAAKSKIQAREKDLKATEQDIKQNAAKMKPDVRKSREEQFAADAKEFRRMSQDTEESLRKKDAELTSNIGKMVMPIIKKIGDEGKYTMIVQGSPQVLYIDNTIDITNEVIKRLDAQGRK